MNDLIKISRYLGSRFDLIQAGGGNTSVKKANRLFVKSSGVYVGDMTNDHGFTTLDLDILQNGINEFLNSDIDSLSKKELEEKGNILLSQAHIKGNKASIETFLHSCFKKYVVHTHPIAVTHALSTDYVTLIKKQFSQAFVSEYKTPGIELLLGIKNALRENNDETIIIFIENHGLVVSSDCAKKAIRDTNAICDIVCKWVGFDFSIYKESGYIFDKLNGFSKENILVQPIKDTFLNNYASLETNKKIIAYTPDIFIYLGFEIVNVDNDFSDAIEKYKYRFNVLPTIICSKGQLYVIGNSYKKVKEIEDVFICYANVMSKFPRVKELDEQEIAYLSGWDAEKYRKEN